MKNLEEKNVSSKMKLQISKLEEKYGTLEKRYFSDEDGNFWDGVDLSCNILGNVASVLKDGTVEMR